MKKTAADQPIWTRRSSKCANDHCLTVSRHQRGVVVFDSITPEIALSFPDPAWRAFLLTLRGVVARTDDTR
ncbi:uncharacterized protein DUF397 [Micromonospora palomenae]|uniref:Uncharacterized protein DUF397 n=1 Tax=Micromonospora palomenae TaxID=1461247 RepID=A0A561WWJ0_9ACTN|nr:uncharacterized protein DUF397 [Micromonospora palomenae]